MKICDLHCDTALALYRHGYALCDAPCAVSLEKVAGYERYVQLMAIFTDSRLNDEEGWEQFWKVKDVLDAECAKNKIPLCKNNATLAEELSKPETKTAFLLTVEDARILAGKEERLETLYNAGVSVITPLWGGLTCMGGSHNTDAGLTDFGKAMVTDCLKLGIAVDLSHASTQSADDILDLAEKHGGKVLATHSNAWKLCHHTRNLNDDRLRRLADLGGIVGVNLYVRFLTETEDCTAADVVRHIEYLTKVMGEDKVAFGADWDGADVPAELCDISRMPTLVPLLQNCGFTADMLDKLYWQNAVDFLTK